MSNKKIFNLLRKSIVFVFVLFYACHTSSVAFLKNDIICHTGFEYEDLVFNKNKEFKKITRFVEEKYQAKKIRNLFYIKSQKQYYCEFYVHDHAIECVLINLDMKVEYYNKVEFDWSMVVQ